MKLAMTEQQAAIWIGSGTVTLLVPCAINALGGDGQSHRAVPPSPPALIAEAGHPLPSTAQIRDASEKIRSQYVAEIQTGKATFTVFNGQPMASGIVATEYVLHTGSGSYVSTLPVFLAGAKAGMGAAEATDEVPAGKTVLWAGDAYLAGTSRQQGADGAMQSLYQYALSPQEAMALLAARDGAPVPPADDASTVAKQ